MMVEDGSLKVLKLLSSTSTKIVQGEVMQLQHKKEIDLIEETYLKIISLKTASLFSAAVKVGGLLSNKNDKTLSSPYKTRNQKVLSEWIDYNGHMNVAYYTLAFDKALDFFFEDVLGIGPSFVEKNKEGPFALKASYNYFNELLEEEIFFVDISILDFDSKRVHVFGEMRKDKSLELSAVFETVLMNMDLNARKVKQYPDRVLELFNIFKSSLGKEKIPVEIGKKITLKK